MAIAHPLHPSYTYSSSGITGQISGTLSGNAINGNNITSIAAEKIIQSYDLRLVSQDQIDKWDSVYKAIEQNNGVNYKWHQTIKITREILEDNNLITLPNNKLFYDYDSKSLVVFVNGTYISPTKYVIANKRQFYFKGKVIALNDTVELIHLNKENNINNYDTNFMAIATAWQYSYTNMGFEPMSLITLDSDYAFTNQDKYSIMVYINGEHISPTKYEILNTRELEFKDNLQLSTKSTVTIIQLSRVLPNEEYIGYMWGESIHTTEPSRRFTLSKDHAFSSLQDRSALVFVNNRISRAYKIVNTNTIEFDVDITENSNIEIIQLGYTADISKLKEIVDIESFMNYFNIIVGDFVKEKQRNQPLGFAGLDEHGYISIDNIDIDDLTEKIKAKLIEQGWTPGEGGGTGPIVSDHTHENQEVLEKLYYTNGKLYVDGYPVGERAIEVKYSVIVTPGVINEYGFELPEDCDTERPINLIINSVYSTMDRDWRLVVNDPPIKDRVYWKDLNLESLIERDDIIYVTYYKKVERLNVVLLPPDSDVRHIHHNKDLLDILSINDKNELCVNNHVIGEAAIEVAYNVIADSSMIINKELILPHDCDVSRSISIVLSSVPQMYGTDYSVEENPAPIPDKIIWTGYDMEHKIETGDKLVVNYYRRSAN